MNKELYLCQKITYFAIKVLICLVCLCFTKCYVTLCFLFITVGLTDAYVYCVVIVLCCPLTLCLSG